VFFTDLSASNIIDVNKKNSSLSLALHWIKNVEMAGVLIADYEKIYEKYGIQINLIERNDIKEHVIDYVSNGNANIGMASGITFLTRTSENLDIKAFGTFFQNSPVVIASIKKNNFLSMASLKNKKIGYRHAANLPILKLMLQKNNLKLSDVNAIKVDLTYNALIKNNVDALLVYEFDEPVTLKIKDIETNLIYASNNGVEFYGSVFFTTSKFIKDNKKILSKFLRATFKGWELFFANKNKYTKIIVSKYFPREFLIDHSETLTFKQQLIMADVIEKWVYLGSDKKNFAVMSPLKWQVGIETLSKQNLLKNNLNVNDVYTNEIALKAIIIR
jgi:ABC-type nitrate/sulfonate/bicarbonate transport system substrate-binding protein